MTESLTIYYERKLSDGAYGSEGLSIGITVELDEGDAADLMRDKRLFYVAMLRDAVLGELAESEAPRVAAVAKAELKGKTQKLEDISFDDPDPPF